MQDRFVMAEKLLAGAGMDGKDTAQQVIKLLDQMPGGFFVYRADGNEEILYANIAMLRIFGCNDFDEFRALTGGTFQGMVHPDDLEEVEKSIFEQIAQSQFDLDYVEYRVVRKDGAVRWLEDHGHFIRSVSLGEIFYVFVADATEKIEQQREERAALQLDNDRKLRCIAEYHRESSRRRELIEGLSIDYESIFYADLDTDSIHAYRLSRQAGELFVNDPPSRDYSGFVQEYIERWVHPEDRGLITDTLNPAGIRQRLAGHPLLHVNYRLLRGLRTEYLQLRIVGVGGGQGSQVVIGARSVDEEIRSALEQKEFLADALSQARSAVAAKNAFLSNMSHDMRTPLNAIKGFTELAKRSTDEPGRLGRYLEMIEVSSGQLLRLISNVLEIARIESGGELVAQEPCSLGEIAGKVRTALFPQIASKNLVMAVDASGLHHPMVYGDAHKLEEILFHLCSNAVKYTGPGGHVWVRVLELEVPVPGLGCYQLVVEDDGIGISRGFLGHIFEFFARENNTTISGVHGTGLGLPIMKSLVEMMNGTIDVESEPGKGSRFTVTLPLRPKGDAQREKPPVRTVEKPYHRKRKLLVVDDNELNLEIAVELLQETGFEVESARDGSMAVERLRRAAPGEFALVLMDIQMPVMDGCSAAREIRALDDPAVASIPIIALSANAFEEDKRMAIESGMNLHLAKPLDIDTLLEQIDRLT